MCTKVIIDNANSVKIVRLAILAFDWKLTLEHFACRVAILFFFNRNLKQFKVTIINFVCGWKSALFSQFSQNFPQRDIAAVKSLTASEIVSVIISITEQTWPWKTICQQIEQEVDGFVGFHCFSFFSWKRDFIDKNHSYTD